MRILDLLAVDRVPRIFLDTEFIQIHDITEIADMDPLAFGQAAQSVQFRKTESLCHAHKSILELFSFLRMLLIIRRFRLINIIGKKAGETDTFHKLLTFFF